MFISDRQNIFDGFAEIVEDGAVNSLYGFGAFYRLGRPGLSSIHLLVDADAWLLLALAFNLVIIDVDARPTDHMVITGIAFDLVVHGIVDCILIIIGSEHFKVLVNG